VERIKSLARPSNEPADEDGFAVYDDIPDDIWARQMPAR
jgi:hypothetical protein